MRDVIAYEGILSRVSQLAPSPSSDLRDVEWLDPKHVLGVSRATDGRLEMFLAGPRIACTSRIVGENLVHGQWSTTVGDRIEANQLQLPQGTHFDAVAAFLCRYLIDCGIFAGVQEAFSIAEPVIELALDPLGIGSDLIVGLSGELLILRALLRRCGAKSNRLLEGWLGWQHSSRDFSYGEVGLEVKTTRGNVSQHYIESVDQVEAGHGPQGLDERALFLVSIGIEPAEPDTHATSIWTVPTLVEEVVTLIEAIGDSDAAQQASIFLERVRAYGTQVGRGYDHRLQQHRILFGRAWQTSFIRSYDVSDPSLGLIRSQDLVPFSAIVPSTISFQVRLPNRVRGDLNPLVGIQALLEELHRRGATPA